MGKVVRLVILGALLIVLIVGTSALCGTALAWGADQTKAGTKSTTKNTQEKLPRLVDVGADMCIPCKMMEPIMEELKREYKGVLEVEFVDIWKNPDAGQKYRIRAIPTQIFYDAYGKELYRHMGFISKEQILNTFKNLGINLKPAAPKKKKGM